MEKLIITMPIAPYDDFSVGKLVAPVLGEMLAKKLDADFIMSVNLLDSYKQRNIAGFIELLKKYDINPSKYWVDSQNVNELLRKIELLVDNGYIYSVTKEILICHCGKVDISKDNLETINMQDSLFYKKEEKYYCKKCNNECHLKKENVLVFDSKSAPKDNLLFYPNFINNDIKTFIKTVGSNEMIISRNRNTGIQFDYNNRVYNLDIDFLWGVYLSLFEGYEKIVLCSNHQLYQLFVVGMLEKCFNYNSKTILLATPHLNVINQEDTKQLEERILSLKLFTIFNQKWSKKENVFNLSLLKYLNSMNVQKKQQLYDLIMSSNINDSELYTILHTALNTDFNFQKATEKLKRVRKNV